jgi:thiol:disulfide interchange protein DsbA
VSSAQNRRVALGRLAAAATALCAVRPALAQVPGTAPNRGEPPQEGANYVRLAQPLAAEPGRIEVIEFFWYGCPHCNAFEPVLEPWSQKLPGDVAFRRVPVYFRERPFAAHQRLFYALEATGQLDKLHRRVFYGIHSERQSLAERDDAVAFVARHGGDGDALRSAWDSFGVQTKVQQARTVAAAYKIDAVPAMGVAGRFYTTGPLAAAGGQATGPGSNERMLVVVDHLVDRVRRGS